MGRALTRAGLRVSHEHMAEDGTSSSVFAADGPYFGSIHHNFHKGETRSNYRFEHMWHLVRNTLDVLGSIGTSMDAPKFWAFQERSTGIPETMEPLARAMKFYLVWNDLVEKQGPTRRLRIEDTERLWPELLSELGLAACPFPAVKCHPGVGKSQFRRDVTWDELRSADAALADLCFVRAKEYGYEGGPG